MSCHSHKLTDVVEVASRHEDMFLPEGVINFPQLFSPWSWVQFFSITINHKAVCYAIFLVFDVQMICNTCSMLYLSSYSLLMIDIPLSDKEAPSLLCEEDQRFPTDAGIDTAVAVYQTPVATDNSGDEVTVVCTPTLGSVLPMGPTNVTCAATDRSSNNATCVLQVNIKGTYYLSDICLRCFQTWRRGAQ